MVSTISYINLSWAVVGIIDKDVRNSLQSMKRPDEPIETTVESMSSVIWSFGILFILIKER